MGYLVDGFSGSFLRLPELQREIEFRKDLITFFKIAKILFKEKPDIVHTHMAKAGAVSRAAVLFYNFVSRKKIKTVHTYHGHVLEGYFSPLKSKLFISIEKILAKITDAIVAISQTQKWELTEKYRVSSSNKTHIINLGFNFLKFIDNKNTKGSFRRKIGVNENDFLIGIIGRLVPIKNHHMFIDSAKILLNKHKTHESGAIKFVIVGDGELRCWLENYTKKLGISGDFIFTGWVKSVEQVYADLDILALTSINEGTPVSIIEGMASSVPVITTGVGGVKDLLGDIDPAQKAEGGFKVCERGILCPKNDAMAFANGIEYILKLGVDSTSSKVEDARNFVLEQYSEKNLIQNMEKLYLKLHDFNRCKA